MDLGVTYIPSHLPAHVAADMRHLAEMGCTEVLFAIQENHIHTLTGALAFGAALAQEESLRPYAVIWGYANTFGGGRMSKVMLDDPEMWCQTREGARYAHACLNNPKVVDRFVEYAALCREHGYQGIFVDEPTKQECFCAHCQRAFAASSSVGLELGVGTLEYAAFRAEVVRHYTEAVCRRVKAADASFITTTCVMPRDRDTWGQVAAIPELDVFGTDPYWLVSSGRMTLADAVGLAIEAKRIGEEHGKLSQVWLNCWRIPAGREEDIYEGGKALADVGCDSLCTWSYRGGLGTNEACDDPELAWASVVRLYRQLAEKG